MTRALDINQMLSNVCLMTNTTAASRQFAAIAPGCSQQWADEDGGSSPCYSDAVVLVVGRYSGSQHMCAAHANHFPLAAKFAL